MRINSQKAQINDKSNEFSPRREICKKGWCRYISYESIRVCHICGKIEGLFIDERVNKIIEDRLN